MKGVRTNGDPHSKNKTCVEAGFMDAIYRFLYYIDADKEHNEVFKGAIDVWCHSPIVLNGKLGSISEYGR